MIRTGTDQDEGICFPSQLVPDFTGNHDAAAEIHAPDNAETLIHFCPTFSEQILLPVSISQL
ncbi:MAG: hypothetical protein MSH16_00785 [Oscillospiraceae bacterium]|nr:hypothetical protein [Oscillospiraceae bacterium]